MQAFRQGYATAGIDNLQGEWRQIFAPYVAEGNVFGSGKFDISQSAAQRLVALADQVQDSDVSRVEWLVDISQGGRHAELRGLCDVKEKV